MSVVVSRPIDFGEVKPATRITYDWAEDIVQSMQAGGLDVIDLGYEVTREKVENALAHPKVDTFIHYGHGVNEGLLGSDNETILDVDNLSLLTDKIVISINCESADNFGADCIASGAKTYLGYAEKVYIRFNNKKQSYIGFKEANNAWNTMRLDGEWVTAGEAFNQIGDVYKGWIEVYDENGYPEISECLDRSMQALLILGDESQYLPTQSPVELLPYKAIYPRGI